MPFLQFFRRLRYYFLYLEFQQFTMIPKSLYVANLELTRHFKPIEGSVVECGTWRGGMISGISRVLGNTRDYYLFDSFEGLPEVTDLDGVAAKDWQTGKKSDDYFNNCTASETEARAAIAKAKIEKHHIHKGWFSQTLPGIQIRSGIAVLRLDGDWYESTMDCLVHLFPQVNTHGVVIIDDYFRWEGCSKAVHDYLSQTKSRCVINVHKGVCFIKKLE